MHDEIIKRALELGRDTGFVTFDQLNDLLPSTTTASEVIENVMNALSDAGINVIDHDG
jgi:RNA polymerase primary sigma factor